MKEVCVSLRNVDCFILLALRKCDLGIWWKWALLGSSYCLAFYRAQNYSAKTGGSKLFCERIRFCYLNPGMASRTLKRNQGVGRVDFFCRFWARMFHASSSWWLPAIFGAPWLLDTSLQSLQLSSPGVVSCVFCGFTCHSPLCIPHFPCIRTPAIGLGPTRIWHDFISTITSA